MRHRSRPIDLTQVPTDLLFEELFRRQEELGSRLDRLFAISTALDEGGAPTSRRSGIARRGGADSNRAGSKPAPSKRPTSKRGTRR